MTSEISQESSRVPSWEEIRTLEERLKELRTKREKEYTALRLYGKCTAIAVMLGHGQPLKYGVYWKYRDDDLVIEYDDYGGNLSVMRNGHYVLKVHSGNLELFRPGPWIRKICQLALKANQIIDERDRIKKFKELTAEIEKWEEVKE